MPALSLFICGQISFHFQFASEGEHYLMMQMHNWNEIHNSVHRYKVIRQSYDDA
jgi:hypothetical protein